MQMFLSHNFCVVPSYPCYAKPRHVMQFAQLASHHQF